jgi:hypothetical protein
MLDRILLLILYKHRAICTCVPPWFLQICLLVTAHSHFVILARGGRGLILIPLYWKGNELNDFLSDPNPCRCKHGESINGELWKSQRRDR